LNHELNTYKITNNHTKFNRINLNFYEEFINNNNSNKKIAFLNNKYNLITPDFKNNICSEKYFNNYRKIYYNNKQLIFLSEYEAIYPENFYIIWNILNKFNIINENMLNFAFIDDGKPILFPKINPLGHIEASIKFCEENFRYEKNCYIRISLNKINIKEIEKKFISLYPNHKTYEFQNNTTFGIKDYFKNYNYDFIIANSIDLNNNFLSLSLCRNKGNIIIYLNNFIVDSNYPIISYVTGLFEKTYLYQSKVQTIFDKSCFLILINYNK